MTGFPHAIVIGALASIIVLFGLFQKNRAWILGGMFLSLSTHSPMITFTAGAAGAIVPSDAVAFVLLLGILFHGFNGMTSPVVPSWRKPYIIVAIIWVLSVILIASWNMPDLAQTYGWKVKSVLPLPLNVQITGFRLFRIGLLTSFFLVVPKLSIDEQIFHKVLICFWRVAVCLAIAQILNRLGVVDLGLNTRAFFERFGLGNYTLGYTKSATNRILFMGFFIALSLAYIRKLSKGLYIASAILMVASILIGGSRGGIVGLVAGMMILAVRVRMRYLLPVFFSAVVLAGVGLFIVNKYQPEALERFDVFFGVERQTGRIEVAKWTLEYLGDEPHVLLTGVGFMNYAYALKPVGAIREHAHNDILTCLTELGLIGLAVFLWWLVSLGKSIWSSGRKEIGQERWISACINAAFIGLSVVMLVETTFYPAGQSMSLVRLEIMLFGVFVAYHIQKQAAEQEYLYYYDDDYDDDYDYDYDYQESEAELNAYYI